MRIHHSTPGDQSTALPNAMLQDERLSYAARGVLAEILSRPDGRGTNADALSRLAKQHRPGKLGEGRRAIRAAFAELEHYGYMVRRRAKDAQGRFITKLDVYDTPGHQTPDAGAARSTQPKNLRGHYLYRHWDKDERLLYVGVAEEPHQRERRHAASSPWMAFQAEMTVEPFASRAEVEAAEAIAIASEQPLFNVAGNETPEAHRRLVEYLVAHGRTDLLAPAVSRG